MVGICLIVLSVGMCVMALAVFLVWPRQPSAENRSCFNGKLFAHRGLHQNNRQIPENSLLAFEKALVANYGIELDVRMTADGQLVVFHDEKLTRMTGQADGIEEKKLIELKKIKLLDSTQTIPSLAEVLDLVGGKVPLLIELKTTKKRTELCQKTLTLLQAYPGWYAIESFDPLILNWWKKHQPQVMRGQLATAASEYKKEGSFGWGRFLLSNLGLNFLGRPNFIAYRLKFAQKPVIKLMQHWQVPIAIYTVHGQKEIELYQDKYEALIFEL